jgi:hypothetical protein
MADLMEADIESPCDLVQFPIGVYPGDKCAVSTSVVAWMADALGNAIQGQRSLLDVVVGRYLLGKEEDRPMLTLQMEKSFGVGVEAVQEPLEAGLQPMVLWTRPHIPDDQSRGRKKYTPLLVGTGIQHQSVLDRSFSLFSPIADIWPPPIVVGPMASCDVMWVFKVKDSPAEHHVLAAVRDCLEEQYAGGFYRRVRN